MMMKIILTKTSIIFTMWYTYINSFIPKNNSQEGKYYYHHCYIKDKQSVEKLSDIFPQSHTVSK